MRLLHLWGIFIAISLNYSSLAEAEKQPFYGQSVGISHNLLKQDLSIYIDQKVIVKNRSRLQKKGLIDTNLSKAEVGFYETALAAMVSIPYVTKILQHLYSSDVKKDSVQVTSYLLTTDLYGNKAKLFCYSFNFNRQLYKKINWSNFKSSNIVKIAPDFKTSDVCKVIEETSPFSI